MGLATTPPSAGGGVPGRARSVIGSRARAQYPSAPGQAEAVAGASNQQSAIDMSAIDASLRSITGNLLQSALGRNLNGRSTTTSTGSGTTTSTGAVGDKNVRNLVATAAQGYGWTGAEWQALDELIRLESGWNPQAKNPKSTAFGLFQFLDSTWKNTGVTKSTDPALQAQAGLRYIKNRYGSPSAALRMWKKRQAQGNAWY